VSKYQNPHLFLEEENTRRRGIKQRKGKKETEVGKLSI
jgi:hypothetical protein